MLYILSGAVNRALDDMGRRGRLENCKRLLEAYTETADATLLQGRATTGVLEALASVTRRLRGVIAQY